MSDEEEKVRKAMKVMAEPEEKILTPTETVQRVIDECKKDGFEVKALAFGQMAYLHFARDVQRLSKPKLQLVDALGDPLQKKDQGDDIPEIVEWEGIKVYKKSTQGFEPLF